MVLLVLSPGDRPCPRHGLSPRSIRFSRYAPPVAPAPRGKEIYCHTRGAAGASFQPSTVPTHTGGAEGPGSPAAAGRARAPTRSDRRTAMGNSGRPGAAAPGRQKRSGAPEGPALHLYGSAVHRSAAPCSPTGFPRSTIGAVRLSFRVRNGTGRAPHAMAADRWAALRPPTRVTRACPEGRTATSRDG